MQIVARHKKVHVTNTEVLPLHAKHLRIRTAYSAISPGTELDMIRNSQDTEVPLGYSAVGIVEACGDEVSDYKIGDVVACYGAPYVKHAEILTVPTTLCAKVPEQVAPKNASLGGIGAIAIHALRQAQLQFGESVVIAGLGLLGQVIAQIADAAAYDVIGYDLNEQRTKLLTTLSNIPAVIDQKDLELWIKEQTNGHGVDAVLLCAGGHKSPLSEQSLKWVRKQGKVVIVGAIEPHFPRHLMFSKEADIRISRAGGPGRYDFLYEKKAVDYPYEYVRWTEGRNVQQFIRLLEKGRINIDDFVKETVHFKEAPHVYESLLTLETDVLTKIFTYD